MNRERFVTVLACLAALAAMPPGICGAVPAAAPSAAAAPAVVVDAFDDVSAWSAVPASGVSLALSRDAGLRGGAMRLDFDFHGGGGYAVAHRAVNLDLPANYRLRFRIRGDAPVNTLEFKLIDSTGANVWWSNQRDFVFPAKWDSVTLKKRHITFAWGPLGGGEIRSVAAIEFAITAGTGGRGTVWLDDLTLQPLPPPEAAPPAPVATASSAVRDHPPSLALDGDAGTEWRCAPSDRRPALTLDLGGPREFGGLVLDWAPDRHALDYTVEGSEDGRRWRALRTVTRGNGGRDWLRLPESEAAFVRVRVDRHSGASVGLCEIAIRAFEWGATPQAFLQAMAAEAPRGTYPRAMSGEQSFWAVVGADDGDPDEGLLGEDGALETGKAQWSVEPFLFAGGRLVTWADVAPEQRLEQGRLPIPTVSWRGGDLALDVTAFAIPPRAAAGADATPLHGDGSRLVARYRVRNLGAQPRKATLFLALRPFQVNPPAQFLNTPGGVAVVREIERDGRVVRVNGDRGVTSLAEPSGFGAAAFDEGDVVADYLARGVLPARSRVSDPTGHASAALAYDLDLLPSAEREVVLVVPLAGPPEPPAPTADPAYAAAAQSAVAQQWRKRFGDVEIALPEQASDLLETMWAQVAWILVNRDRAAIQPGSRSYERSWIRDGSLTSSALLRLGFTDVVRDYAEWFAGHQYADGKVPCCVDARGADPVPEHDSSGELIFLIAEYVRVTGDRAFAERMWPAVAGAVGYLDSLRGLRRTPEWREPGREEFFGLLPPSISHEGYSAKPMHSYWDDLFALRGFKDAVYLAGLLGLDGERRRIAAIRDEFAADLAASVRAAIRRHGIDFVPGCADLGDFDATSTTIAFSPVHADSVLPRAALERTFERYWEFFTDRRDGREDWEAFTPYEMRNIGAFVHLGWRDRAAELTRFFMEHRTPAGWREWAEVVWNPHRTPRFIGDLPHTWVGSDFVRSVLGGFAHEREADSALVIGAGVPWDWVATAPGVTVRRLRTSRGPLGYTMRASGARLEVRIERGVAVPPGGIVVRPPGPPEAREWKAVAVNGKPARPARTGEIVVRDLPATVTVDWRK